MVCTKYICQNTYKVYMYMYGIQKTWRIQPYKKNHFTGTIRTGFVFTGAVDHIITAVALGHTPAVRGALDALLVTKPATCTSKQQLQHGDQSRTGRSIHQKSDNTSSRAECCDNI